MNSYQRLEINLLPPELAPGPAVRLSTIFNVIASCLVIGMLLLHLIGTMSVINNLKAQNKKDQETVTSAEAIKKEYLALKEIKDFTEGRGKLVGMASATYVEFPVILDRISRILPEGVALVKASSAGSSGTGNAIILEFQTATGDPALMSRTLEGFKASPLFLDAYLSSGAFRPQPLDEMRERFGIPYRYDGPGNTDEFIAETYAFEIRTAVNSPLEIDDLSTVMDKSEYMIPFELTSDPSATPAAPPPAAAAKGAGAAAGGAPPAGGAPAAKAGNAAPAAGGGS